MLVVVTLVGVFEFMRVIVVMIVIVVVPVMGNNRRYNIQRGYYSH
jgi:hypothetical protein